MLLYEGLHDFGVLMMMTNGGTSYKWLDVDHGAKLVENDGMIPPRPSFYLFYFTLPEK